MPKCLDCNNTVKFFVPVYGYQIFYYKGDFVDNIIDEQSEVDGHSPIKCGECESQNLEGNF